LPILETEQTVVNRPFPPLWQDGGMTNHPVPISIQKAAFTVLHTDKVYLIRLIALDPLIFFPPPFSVKPAIGA
jgi:hypothetical protein